MHIRVDSREQDRIGSARSFFEEKGHTVTVEELSTGDFVFDDAVCCEFKRIDDFFSSLNDNRLNNQALRMYESYPHCMVVVEENKKILTGLKKYWSLHEIKANAHRYDSTIASLSRYCTVVTRPTEKSCFKFMLLQAEKFLSDKVLFYKPTVKVANPATNFLSMIPGIGAKTALSISEEFDLFSLSDLMSLNKSMLTNVRGVGDKTADNILKGINGA